jgi:hypothetical protein
MWRDGLTVIALASGLPDRKPDYLTFAQATEGGAIEVQEAAVQSVPTVEARVGPMPVLLPGGGAGIRFMGCHGSGTLPPVAARPN